MVIVWRVVEACTLECAFCGYSRELIRPRLSADPDALLAFGAVLRDVQSRTGQAILVSWIGGEPLSWRDLPDVSRKYRREFGLRLGITTNGVSFQSAQLRELVLAEYEQMTISIDGLAAFHDRVRGQTGLFDRLRSIVELLRSEDDHRRLWRRVNTVLMRENIAAFGEFCLAMAEWGFHELTFNQLGGNERPEFFAANRLQPEQVDRFAAELPHLRQRMAERGMAIRGSERYLARIVASTNSEQIAIEDCHPGTDFLFISAEGRISPCSCSNEAYGIPISEVRTAEEFLQLPARFRRIRRENRLAACDDCHATHVFDKFKDQSQVHSAEIRATT